MSIPVSRPVRFEVVTFDALTNRALYQLLQLRSEVFIVEQTCPYQDLDGKDFKAMHVLGFATIGDQEKLVACARVLPAGVSYPEPSIGRVANSSLVRGTGTGRRLMTEAIACAERAYTGQGIRISAQHYLEKFYQSLGFATKSEPYLEDGIPHVEMLRLKDPK